MKFKTGDHVVLATPAGYPKYGGMHEYWNGATGILGEIDGATFQLHPDNDRSRIGKWTGDAWFDISWLKGLVKPLSSFEQSIIEYIAAEKKELGI